MKTEELEKLKKEIISRIRPEKKGREEMQKAVKKLTSLILEKVKKSDKRIEIAVLGSVSRDTWLRDEKDIDFFLKFPVEYKKDEMEKIVENIGKKVLKKFEKRFAEHPYIKGKFNGFEAELVPCYKIKNLSRCLSSVDRTPFHDKFVRQHIKGKEDEVRVLKQFLKGIGIYGAEIKIQGFSGYLCELLTIKYGSFEEVLKNAGKWKRGMTIRIQKNNKRKTEAAEEDLKEKLLRFENAPLIFIDPVDENRNVASALSEENFYYFTVASKKFLENPGIKFFFPEKRKRAKKEVEKKIEEKSLGMIAVSFSKPDVIEDVLYSQLRKAEKLLKNLLQENSFSVLRSCVFANDDCLILFELFQLELPNAELRMGPEIGMKKHEEEFLKKYSSGNPAALTSPFLLGNRLAVYVKRKFRSAEELLTSFLSNKELEKKGMPKYIAAEIRKKFKIDKNAGIVSKSSAEALNFIANFVDPKFPWED